MKRNHSCNATTCKCDKCGAEAHSIPGSQHRNCGGNKHARLSTAKRGKWQPA